MKVVFTGYLFDFDKGSASTNLAVEYAMGFKSLGYETVLVSHSSKKNKQKRASVYKGVECIQFKNSFTIIPKIERYFYSLLSVLKLWSYFFVNKKNTAFIFAFSTHASQLFWQILISKFFRIPIVYYLVEEQISLHRHSKTLSIRKKIKRILNELFDYKFQYLVLFRLCDYVGCITIELQKYLNNKWKLNSESLLYLPNVKYISGDYIGKKFDTDEVFKTIEIYYGGAIHFDKEDLMLLISEMSKVRDKCQIKHFRITITGYGKDADKLKKFICENELMEWVSFKGFVDIGEQVNFLENSDICLVLKTDIEYNRYNFPTKLLDYLFYRKLVLLTPLQPYNNFFIDKQNCLIIDKVNEIHLSKQLEWLQNNPDKINTIRNNAFKTVVENFNAVNAAEFIIQKLSLK